MASVSGTLGLSGYLNPTDEMLRGTVDRAAAAGQQIASQVLAGVTSSASSAFGAGMQISQSLLQGVMQPFGTSGIAVTNFAGSIANSMQSLFESGLKAAGGLFQAGASLVTTAAGFLATGAGAIIGLALGGPAIGAAIGGGIALIAGQLIGVFTSALSGLVTVAADTMGELSKVVGEGLNTLLQIVQDVVQTAVQRAQSVGSLTYSNNMGWDNASSLFTRLSGFGVNAGSMQQMFGGQQQMPWMFGMRASAYNVPNYTDPGFLEKLAVRFQGMRNNGPIGVLQSNSMLNGLGINTPDMLRILSMRPEKIRGQQEWMQNTQMKMGITPEMLRGFAEDFPLLMTRISEFIEMIKVRFLSELIPVGQQLLEGFSNYLSNNTATIVARIKAFGAFLVNDFPIMLLKGVSALFNFGASLGKFLQGMMLTLASWLTDFQKGGGMMNFLRPLATMADAFLDTLRSFVVGFAYVQQTMINVAYGGPLGTLLNKARGLLGLSPIKTGNAMQAAQAAYNAIPAPNAVTTLNNFYKSGAAGNWASSLTNGAANVGTAAAWMQQQAQQAQNAAQGWPAVVAQLQQSNQTLNQIAGNTKSTADALPRAVDVWGAEIGSRIVRAHRAAQRRGQ